MKNTNTQTLKGFRDFLPQEALKRDWLKQKIISVFDRWGYDPMETPTLEPLELFEGQIGEDEKLFYKFRDPGDRDVALKYDQTVPACRVVGANWQDLPKPFKRYQIQPAFRAENTQKGRYREFLQCDADIFGMNSVLADAEVVALSLDIYKQIGFKDVRVIVNDRELLKDVPYEVVVAVDKLKKIGESGVIKDMIKKGFSEESARNYLEFFKNLEPSEKIKTIFKYLKKLGFDKDWYKFEPTLARSFSYSTGPIWEVEIDNFNVGSVLGGERFDQLVERVSGVSIPATGFAVGFDRTLEAAEQVGLIPDLATNTQVLVTVFNADLYLKSLEIAKALREQNINTELYPDLETKLGKQFKYADKRQIPYVITIGPEEAEKNTVNLKDMTSGEEREINASEAISMLK